MKKQGLRHLSFRVNDETLEKLHVIADYYGRSANGHVFFLVQEDIRKFEREIGKIEQEDIDKVKEKMKNKSLD